MSLPATVVLLIVGAILTGLSLWQQRRPREIGSMALPAVPILAIGLLLVILALGHLVSLLTGHPFTGRLRP